jgi:hypothetical protein
LQVRTRTWRGGVSQHYTCTNRPLCAFIDCNGEHELFLWTQLTKI